VYRDDTPALLWQAGPLWPVVLLWPARRPGCLYRRSCHQNTSTLAGGGVLVGFDVFHLQLADRPEVGKNIQPPMIHLDIGQAENYKTQQKKTLYPRENLHSKVHHNRFSVNYHINIYI